MKSAHVLCLDVTVDESAFVLADHPAMLDDPFLAGALSRNLCTVRSPDIATRSSRIRTCRSFRAALANGMRNLKPTRRRRAIAFERTRVQTRAHPGWAEHRSLELMVSRPQADGRPCRRDTRERRDARSDRSGTLEPGKRQTSWCCRPIPWRRPENERLVSVFLAWRSRDSSGGHLANAR